MTNRVLITILIGVYLTIYPILLFGKDTGDWDIFSSLDLADYYHFDAADDPHGYLIGYSSITGYRRTLGKNILTLQYHQQELLGQISHLSEPGDRITLVVPDEYLVLEYAISTSSFDYTPCLFLGKDLGLKLGLSSKTKAVNYYGDLTTRMRRARIEYQIGTEDGDIPFYWIDNSLRGGFRTTRFNTWLCYNGTIPYHSDSLFVNSIYLNRLEGGLDADLGIAKASMTMEYGLVLADLQYRGEQYGKLDKLQYMTLNSTVSHSSGQWQYGIALDGYLSGIGSDSYFDIWPFTFWDTFLAHRTRLKALTLEALAPGMSVNYSTNADTSNGFKLDVGMGYHQLIHTEDVIIKNRRVVLYPLIYTYDTDQYNWQDDLDAYLNIPLAFQYKFSRGKVSFAVQQIVPINWSDLFKKHSNNTDPSSHPPSLRNQWGGLTGHLGVEFSF